VIIAIGTSPNPLVPRTTIGLEISKHGTIIAKENGRPQKRSVAGGDAVTGAATVISAMGAGKIAARAINEFLKGNNFRNRYSHRKPNITFKKYR